MKVINTEIYNVLYLLHEETIKITRSARGMNLIRDNEIVNNLTWKLWSCTYNWIYPEMEESLIS